MDCVDKSQKERYERARIIANARFDYCPRYICYCDDEKDVAAALTKAKNEGLKVRVRSGGHQHEGMCSGNDVLIIDLSPIHGCSEPDRDGRVWVGAGTRLEEIYKQNFLFPGGGCDHVGVGGVVQGGGWGPVARKFGLTCDSLLGVELVTASGEHRIVTGKTESESKLLWAIRGGGGGNFGVITKFLFQTEAKTEEHNFTMIWENPSDASEVACEWATNFPNDHDLQHTSFCRLTTKGLSSDYPATVGGKLLGQEKEIEPLLKRLLPKTFDKGRLLPTRRAFTHPLYQPGPPLAALRALAEFRDLPDEVLESTCIDESFAYPHKVSSSFPKANADCADLFDTVSACFEGYGTESKARLYLSLHCLGGAVMDKGEKRSAFPFRDKPFMLQFQAWWVPNSKELEERYLGWIRKSVAKVDRFTEGAFINFPDVDLVPDHRSPGGRKKLLAYYYGKNLGKLIKIKHHWDRENVFDFPMGIPVE